MGGMTTMDPITKADEKETSRVEAFSDGVFAIAITLLVLDIKVPHIGQGPLAVGLLHLWPSFIGYVLGFSTIGVMWLNHHRLFTMIQRVDDALLFLNTLLLLFVSFTPFPTAVLAEHLGAADARIAALLYTGNSVVLAIAYVSLWRHAAKDSRLLGRHVAAERVDALSRQYAFGPICYILAFGVAWVSAWGAIGICAALALFFSLPPSWLMRKYF
jgi:uncharacterized membrane protein